jgi:hypothetical protein
LLRTCGWQEVVRVSALERQFQTQHLQQQQQQQQKQQQQQQQQPYS